MKKLTAILLLLALGAFTQPLTASAQEDYGTAVEADEGDMDYSMDSENDSEDYADAEDAAADDADYTENEALD